MGFFDWFKGNKAPAPAVESGAAPLVAPRFEYIYGFVSGNPERHSGDLERFGVLASLILGEGGGVTIGASYHPYQALHPTQNIWASCLQGIHQTQCVALDQLQRDSATFHMNPPTPNAVLPMQDQRLMTNEHKEYETYVPFLIPFLSFSKANITHGEQKIWEQVRAVGNAQAYMDSISAALQFLFASGMTMVGTADEIQKALDSGELGHNMPIGFGVYTPGNESAVIDDYERFREKVLSTWGQS